MTFKG